MGPITTMIAKDAILSLTPVAHDCTVGLIVEFDKSKPPGEYTVEKRVIGGLNHWFIPFYQDITGNNIAFLSRWIEDAFPSLKRIGRTFYSFNNLTYITEPDRESIHPKTGLLFRAHHSKLDKAKKGKCKPRVVYESLELNPEVMTSIRDSIRNGDRSYYFEHALVHRGDVVKHTYYPLPLLFETPEARWKAALAHNSSSKMNDKIKLEEWVTKRRFQLYRLLNLQYIDTSGKVVV